MNELGIFVRHPQPGACKTRLGKTIGADAAAELYAAFVCDLMNRFGTGSNPFVVAATPQNAQSTAWFEERVPAGAEFCWQPEDSFGNRIDWFFAPASDSESARVLIGSDSPDLPDDLIAAAFERLQDADVVFAPATDGGMVLIGSRDWPEGVGEEIEWSAPLTLCGAIDAVRQRGKTVALLDPWYDVDDQNGLGTLIARQVYGESAESTICPQTRALLERIHGQL